MNSKNGKIVVFIIAAIARNGVIGIDNGLPWRLKADMQHFRALTMGHPILMGRKTWESLGRPLPGRRNFVVTRDAQFQAEGAEVFHDTEEAIAAELARRQRGAGSGSRALLLGVDGHAAAVLPAAEIGKPPGGGFLVRQVAFV